MYLFTYRYKGEVANGLVCEDFVIFVECNKGTTCKAIADLLIANVSSIVLHVEV